MSSTKISRHFDAPRRAVYEALVDPDLIAKWRFPLGMQLEVHEFERGEGGRFRISLTYEDAERPGKTSGRTDTYRGRFVKLVASEQVVEVDEFETSDPSLQGEMTITITLSDAAGGGTELRAVHENIPRGVAPADNAQGWQSALDRLRDLVEAP